MLGDDEGFAWNLWLTKDRNFGYHAAMGDLGNWIVDNRMWLLSLLAIFISAALAIALYRLNKAKQQIDYQIINDVMIVSRHASSLREKLHIEYEAHTLQNPRIVTIKFINTGNKAIEGSDFKQAITVRHGQHDDIRAIDGFIVDQAADGIVTEIFDRAAGNKYIQIEPDLLNPREWFTVQFLYDHDEPLKLSCRFKGQTRSMKELFPVSTREVFRFTSRVAFATLPLLPYKTIEVAHLFDKKDRNRH